MNHPTICKINITLKTELKGYPMRLWPEGKGSSVPDNGVEIVKSPNRPVPYQNHPMVGRS
jgi:hypothetical protein